MREIRNMDTYIASDVHAWRHLPIQCANHSGEHLEQGDCILIRRTLPGGVADGAGSMFPTERGRDVRRAAQRAYWTAQQ